MPLYFDETELPLFIQFLDRDRHRPYDIIFIDDTPVACGGIGLNESTEFTKEKHVIMCWGMVDNKHHKEGYGTILLKHRIELSKQMYPGVKIALGTTQHTFGFFEKFGFKTVAYKKDHWAPGLDLYQMELL